MENKPIRNQRRKPEIVPPKSINQELLELNYRTTVFNASIQSAFDRFQEACLVSMEANNASDTKISQFAQNFDAELQIVLNNNIKLFSDSELLLGKLLDSEKQGDPIFNIQTLVEDVSEDENEDSVGIFAQLIRRQMFFSQVLSKMDVPSAEVVKDATIQLLDSPLEDERQLLDTFKGAIGKVNTFMANIKKEYEGTVQYPNIYAIYKSSVSILSSFSETIERAEEFEDAIPVNVNDDELAAVLFAEHNKGIVKYALLSVLLLPTIIGFVVLSVLSYLDKSRREQVMDELNRNDA